MARGFLYSGGPGSHTNLWTDAMGFGVNWMRADTSVARPGTPEELATFIDPVPHIMTAAEDGRLASYRHHKHWLAHRSDSLPDA